MTEMHKGTVADDLDRLFRAVAGAPRLLILTHNDPDPDSIASALALRHLLSVELALACEVTYRGIIGRAENRALVHYLGKPLRRLSDADLAGSDPGALVDTQPGAGNNAWPKGRPPAVVIDHHPRRPETDGATFADIRSDVGATSTILTGYLQSCGLDLPTPLATALFYGIQTDTMGLSRSTCAADVAAYFWLQPHIDAQALAEIERAQVPVAYFRTFDAALRAAHLYDGTVVAYIGPMDYPDMAAEMADLLLRLEGAYWVICMGAYRNTLIISVRSRRRRLRAEELVQAIVGGEGSAGGHGVMASGQIPLGDRDPAVVAEELRRRALAILQVSADEPGEALV
jgi:nanoRNase/pAp phosphatase (c-di-AMP/oligoRNAs hydrolase)